uniref:Phosphodiesterase n=1 Tax=Timema cristinae TaxID=61476 RepID=A0A7R9CT66_TIMCR|nr:unnamed protein product [Timema cristinae]
MGRCDDCHSYSSATLFCAQADSKRMLKDMALALQQNPTQACVVWELAGCVSSAVGAEEYKLYLVNNRDLEQLEVYLGKDVRFSNDERKFQILGPNVSLAQFVAQTKKPLRFSRGDPDPRFRNWLLLKPVMKLDGTVVAVMELCKQEGATPFHEEDQDIASSYLDWGGIALQYTHLYLSINNQRCLKDFLLTIVNDESRDICVSPQQFKQWFPKRHSTFGISQLTKRCDLVSIFQNILSMDALVIKVMKFAQRLVDADRASLFLVDSKNKQLYARIWDVGVHNSDDSTDMDEKFNIDANVSTLKEIRFPLGSGIAGQVAVTGKVVNITDAYCDPRFNRNIDQLTGYQTKSILCMPILIRDEIIGVVQMVNKHSGKFTKEDEEAFEMFAVYCGLALHHSQLYDKIANSEQKYRVALDILSYHNTCTEDEVEQFSKQEKPNIMPGIDEYYFDVFALDDFEKARHAIYMFKDLFGEIKFNKNSLVRFTLTVKKNYRRIPYHNWTHGFSVANSVFCIIKHSPNLFTTNEALAMYVGSLCHDLDHRGKNNKFMLETESPLAAIYSTSIMEHHHFNQTVTILQQKGHNIFSKLTSSEYKQVLDNIKHCILATDLAMFFLNKTTLNELVTEDQFSWSNHEHRLLLKALTMTGSDLSASAKPWDLQMKTVRVIFEEFYEQGDAERDSGRIPNSMMDRRQPDQQAASQVGFLTGICVPCYNLLYRLIPTTKPLLDQCEANLKRWIEINEEVMKSKEEQLRQDKEQSLQREEEDIVSESSSGGGENNESKEYSTAKTKVSGCREEKINQKDIDKETRKDNITNPTNTSGEISAGGGDEIEDKSSQNEHNCEHSSLTKNC